MRRVFAMPVFAALVLLAPSAVGQGHLPADPMFCDPASYPYDAVTAAPYSHRVLFEDEHVRVLDIRLPPGASEPVHIHALPSVIFGETGGSGGAKFVYTEYQMVDGKFVEVSHNEVTPTAGYRTVWSPPEGPHSISNIGGVAVRFTRLEIKPESCAG
jgi:hypothetical protein